MKIKLSEIEKKLQFKLKRNAYCIGVDVASTTGIAILETDKKMLEIQTDIFKLPTVTKEDEKAEKYVEKLEFMYKFIKDFSNKIKAKQHKSILVLENSYMGFNSYTFGQLKAMCGICFAVLYDLFETIKIVFATTARKEVGFKSNLKKSAKREEKKKELIDFINNIFNSHEVDDNITDAILLALYGLKEE